MRLRSCLLLLERNEREDFDMRTGFEWDERERNKRIHARRKRGLQK